MACSDSYARRAGAADGTATWLCGWGAHALYIGATLGLSAHRNAVAVLAFSLDGCFQVADDPGSPGAAGRSCRSVLIFPNTLHQLLHTCGRMAFLYLDACSPALARLRNSAGCITSRCAFDVHEAAQWIAVLDHLACERRPWPEIQREIMQRLGQPIATADARLRSTLEALHDDSTGVRLEILASRVGLSASRLRHLFKAATGVPLTRYRLWMAMSRATRCMLRGASLTRAALDAGFASSAHFSSAYRDMFGLEPSRLAKLPWDRGSE